jgi:hypothetical protein
VLWFPNVTQLFPLQHPAQLTELQGVTQMPLWHEAVPVHAVQVAPLCPHSELLCPETGTHVLPLQQPEGQLVELHVVVWQLPL